MAQRPIHVHYYEKVHYPLGGSSGYKDSLDPMKKSYSDVNKDKHHTYKYNVQLWVRIGPRVQNPPC